VDNPPEDIRVLVHVRPDNLGPDEDRVLDAALGQDGVQGLELEPESVLGLDVHHPEMAQGLVLESVLDLDVHPLEMARDPEPE
jgi:hypothetical protein